ncbi:MAG TPA: hypothetical protein VK904_04820 [Miltoncostaeaceae bacterium]|nr:hypothetical protein [Miltoncostaeaceae bacterium]
MRIIREVAFGAANATLDVAMNAHGVAVERTLGRPIMSSLHAGWSIGGLLGAGLGGLLAAGAVDARLNLILVPAAACGLALVVSRALLPAAEDIAPALPALRLPSPRIALLGLVAFCSLFAEGVAADWSASTSRTRWAPPPPWPRPGSPPTRSPWREAASSATGSPCAGARRACWCGAGSWRPPGSASP